MKRLWLCIGLIAAMAVGAQDRAPEMLVEIENGGRQGIRISEVDVTVTVHGELALVRQTITFQNPHAGQTRGDLRFPLPEGAVISGYGLDVRGRMIDGVAVEKARARAVFEEIVAERQDPGLVEWEGGNMFTTRVFPIPGKGTRSIFVEYTQPLEAQRDRALLSLPFWYRDSLDRFRLSVIVLEADGEPKLEADGMKPPGFKKLGSSHHAEIVLEQSSALGEARVSVPIPEQVTKVERARDGNVYFSILAPGPDPRKTRLDKVAAPQRIRLYWDASASTSTRTRTPELALLAALFDELRRQSVVVELVPFRYSLDPVQSITVADGNTDELIRAIQRLDADGATNLAAVTPAASNPDLYLVVTDGRQTLGETPTWSGFGAPVFSISAGGDLPLLRDLTRPTGGDAIDLRNFTEKNAVAAILEPALRLQMARLLGSGAADLIVSPFPDAAGRHAIYGRLSGPEASVVLTYGAGRQAVGRQEITIRRDDAVQADMIRRQWASVRLNTLLGNQQANGNAIAALGEAQGLVTPYTSLMVLERLDQYITYRIAPPTMLPEMRSQYFRAVAKDQRGVRRDRRVFSANLASWGKAVGGLLKNDAVNPDQADGDGEMGLAFFPVPAGVFYRGSTRESSDSMFGDDDDDDMVIERPAGDGGGFGNEDDFLSDDPVTFEPESASTERLMKASRDRERRASEAGTVNVGAITGAWDPAMPYMARLRAAAPDDAYRVYLYERLSHRHEPTFYQDCAAYFRDAGMPELSLRVLGNLAELADGDPKARLVLARELRMAGHAAAAVPLLADLLAEDPSALIVRREYVLSLEAVGRHADAVRELLVGLQPTPGETGVTSMQRVLLSDLQMIRQAGVRAQAELPIVPAALVYDLQVGLRVVLTCPDPDVDIDLWVSEPGDVTVFSGRPASAGGGRLIVDGSWAEGLEDYMRLDTGKGLYQVYAYFAGRVSDGDYQPVTVFVDVYTAAGTAQQSHRQAVIRLSDIEDLQKIMEITY